MPSQARHRQTRAALQINPPSIIAWPVQRVLGAGVMCAQISAAAFCSASGSTTGGTSIGSWRSIVFLRLLYIWP